MVAFADNIDDLPSEIKTATFAHFANCGRGTVLNMIRQKTLPARPLNPASKRLTYVIPTRALRLYLGVEPAEPEYQSKLLSGRRG
jgi:hypothetical protein